MRQPDDPSVLDLIKIEETKKPQSEYVQPFLQLPLPEYERYVEQEQKEESSRVIIIDI